MVAQRLLMLLNSPIRSVRTVAPEKAGFDALTGIMGDAWGSAAASNMISDAKGLQDIHVVLPKVPAGTGWGGYFWGLNNYLKSNGGNFTLSNEALVFFVNGTQVSQAMNFYKSTLIHELCT
jgi:hypothetical protein